MTTPQGAGALPGIGIGVPRTINNVGRALANGQLLTGIGFITCISALGVSATVAQAAYLLDGTDTTGEYLAALSVPAGGGQVLAPVWPGIYFKRGIYYEPKTGGMILIITYVPLLEPLT